MLIFEVTGWTMVEAEDKDDAFSIAGRLLVGHGWFHGQIVDDGVRLLPPDEADGAPTEPVSAELRAERKQWDDDGGDSGLHRAR